MAAAVPLTSSLKLFADPTRLRMMGLLEREELSVGELSRALGLAQSRVSNHLRLLREAGLLAERHAGTSTFLRLAPAAGGEAFAGRIWGAVRAELAGLSEHRADLMRLEEVLGERRIGDGEFFDRVAGEWDKIGVDFETGEARQRVAAQVFASPKVVADLGCGTGYFARALSGLAARVICIDRSRRMLEEARERARRAGRGTAFEFRLGELDALPLCDGELDGVVAGMVLHHLPSLEQPLAEMRRVLKPGGNAVVLELAPHREAWMRGTLGDRHLGLAAEDVVTAMRDTGFEDVALEPVRDHYRPRRPGGESDDPPRLGLYLVRATKPRARTTTLPDDPT